MGDDARSFATTRLAGYIGNAIWLSGGRPQTALNFYADPPVHRCLQPLYPPRGYLLGMTRPLPTPFVGTRWSCHTEAGMDRTGFHHVNMRARVECTHMLPEAPEPPPWRTLIDPCPSAKEVFTVVALLLVGCLLLALGVVLWAISFTTGGPQ